MTEQSDRMDKINRSLAWLRKRRLKSKRNPLGSDALSFLKRDAGEVARKLWKWAGAYDGGLSAIVLCIMFCLYLLWK